MAIAGIQGPRFSGWSGELLPSSKAPSSTYGEAEGRPPLARIQSQRWEGDGCTGWSSDYPDLSDGILSVGLRPYRCHRSTDSDSAGNTADGTRPLRVHGSLPQHVRGKRSPCRAIQCTPRVRPMEVAPSSRGLRPDPRRTLLRRRRNRLVQGRRSTRDGLSQRNINPHEARRKVVLQDDPLPF